MVFIEEFVFRIFNNKLKIVSSIQNDIIHMRTQEKVARQDFIVLTIEI